MDARTQTYLLEALLVLIVVAGVARLTAPGEAPLHLTLGGKRYASFVHAGIVGATAAALIVGLYYATPEIEKELKKLEGGDHKNKQGTKAGPTVCASCPTGACW